MINQSKSHIQLHNLYSWRRLSRLIIFLLLLLLQGPINISAQANQYESVIGLSNRNNNNNNNNIRSTTTTSIALNNDEMNDEDIYDEETEINDESPSSTVKSTSLNKFMPNITSRLPIQPEEIPKSDYDDEQDSYANDDQLDDETTNSDYSQSFDDTDSIKHPEINPINNSDNNRKDLSTYPTSRLPFGPANLWRDLFSKPGILVGIVGGVVIGMLSAILLVMFIIYRMRKKDEGSYALEEGPRKSPSHAYTRVSSREFFA